MYGALIAMISAFSPVSHGGDLDGLDMTLEVLSKDQVLDSPAANRIEIPVLTQLDSTTRALRLDAGADTLPLGQVTGELLGPLQGPLQAVDGLTGGVLSALGLVRPESK